MSSGFRVVCSDGVSRHEPLFRTRRDAEAFTAVHRCRLSHIIRREATWRVAEFRIVAGAEPYATKHPAALPSTPAPATPSSVIEAVFGKEPAHA